MCVWKLQNEETSLAFTSYLQMQEDDVKRSFVWYWNLDTQKIKTEIVRKFWYVVLAKNGGQLCRSCENLKSITKIQGRERYSKNNKK